MRTKALFICLIASTNLLIAQTESSKKLAPIKMLPENGEIKQIYELYAEVEYTIYDKAGAKYQCGKAAFIDYTSFPSGTYFIRYKDAKGEIHTEKFEKK